MGPSNVTRRWPARCGDCALHDWMRGGRGRADLVGWAVRFSPTGRVTLIESYRMRADTDEQLRWRVPATRRKCRHGHTLVFDVDEVVRQIDRGDDVVYLRSEAGS